MKLIPTRSVRSDLLAVENRPALHAPGLLGAFFSSVARK
jgi:hypothetical protein